MTPETQKDLRKSIETRLDRLTNELDSLKLTFKKLELSEKFSAEKDLNINFQGIKNLINYRLFISILTADLCCAMLDYLNSKFQYQGLFSSRQIIVIISEGYKKIYNFTFENERGDLISKHRNKSFWIEEIGYLINELPDFKQEYDLITNKLDNYLSVNFELLKKQRDLSIHYDKEPMKVISMLADLNVEKTFKKMIPFLQILNEMDIFTSNLSKGYLRKLNNSRREFEDKLDNIDTLLTKSITSNNKIEIEALRSKVSELKMLFTK